MLYVQFNPLVSTSGFLTYMYNMWFANITLSQLKLWQLSITSQVNDRIILLTNWQVVPIILIWVWCGRKLFWILDMFFFFWFNGGRSFSGQHCSPVMPSRVGTRAYKQSGVTLIRTDCEVFVIHCTGTTTSQMQYWSKEQCRWTQNFGFTSNEL